VTSSLLPTSCAGAATGAASAGAGAGAGADRGEDEVVRKAMTRAGEYLQQSEVRSRRGARAPGQQSADRRGRGK